MKVIIAGSRHIQNGLPLVYYAVAKSGFNITTVISGGARGIDMFGEQYAFMNNIDLERFPADWAKYGKKAGFIRNEEMARNASAAIVIWDGKSPGSRNMLEITNNGIDSIPVYELNLSNHVFSPVPAFAELPEEIGSVYRFSLFENGIKPYIADDVADFYWMPVPPSLSKRYNIKYV